MKHLIIDTDIGGDPDDLFALILALKSPELSVDLIITSDEHMGRRVSFAKRVLKEFNMGIPVVFGSDLNNSVCCVVCHSEDESPKKDFLPFVDKLISKYDELYYLCIGPQTNLARIVTELPSAKEKLKIHIMGGNFVNQSLGKSEHNVRFDIGAAQTVISSGCNQKWVTAEITYDERLAVEFNNYLHKKIQSSKHLTILDENCRMFWKSLYPKNYLHDPVVLATIISNDVMTFESKKLKITDEGFLELSEDGFSVDGAVSFNLDLFLSLLQRIF